MTGVVLEASEFAYLLLTVGAEDVLGLDAPDLFPKNAEAQDQFYRQGWEQLIGNGWVTPLEERENVYEFDPILTEMVAIVGTPQLIVATSSTDGSKRQLLLHYVSDETIVELSALENNQFALGLVPELDDLTDRVAELLDVTEAKGRESLLLPTSVFERMKSFKARSFSKKLRGELSEVGLDQETIESLEGAFTGERGGEIVIASLAAGEVEHGRRAWILGSEESSWMFYSTDSEGEDIVAEPSSVKAILAWLERSINDL